MTYAYISSGTLITKDVFKKIIKTERKSKIVPCKFSHVFEIDIEDLFKFVDNHLSENSRLFLAFKSIEKLDKMKNAIIQREEERKNIKKTYFRLSYRLDEEYETKI